MDNLTKNLLLFFGGVTMASISGIMPRIGPGRAISLAFRSKVAPYHGELSNRTELISQLLSLSKHRPHNYVVVTGPQGVGKSCLIDTTFRHSSGVFRIGVQSGQDADAIVDAALHELTGLNCMYSYADLYSNARRVVSWYRLLSGGDSPVIIIKASERGHDQPYASLAAASRTLTEDFQLRVIIDGIVGALEPKLFQTNRDNVLQVDAMDRATIENHPQLKTLMSYVNRFNLSDVVWSVLGGVPASYEKLNRTIKIAMDTSDDDPSTIVQSVISEHLCNHVFQSIGIVKEAKCISDMSSILTKMNLNTLQIIDEDLPNEWKRPSPDYVLRKVMKDGQWLLVPSSNSIGIVLRHRLTQKPSKEQLVELTSQQN
ncbi:hypothetical protein MP228_001420 [Amoeboaphelidium protococcarum]|nr:hypothetical protein MP228_001420 [Amoeboaphelidium protococcarum]